MRIEKYLQDITQEDLKSAIESERSNIHTFVILTKLLCAKKDMTDSEWEGLFRKKHTHRIGIRHDLKLIRSITEHCRNQKEELSLVE